MKAAVYYENGPPDVLRYEDVPDPQCHPKGIVIRVEAVSIEGGDTLNRHGGPLMTNPHVVGYQAAGTIIEVGTEVTHLKVGQKVATTGGWGVVNNLDEKIEKALLIDAGVGGFLDNFFAQGRHRVYIKNKICF